MAIKLNVMLAVASDLPTFCTLVPGIRHDVHFLDEISIWPERHIATFVHKMASERGKRLPFDAV